MNRLSREYPPRPMSGNVVRLSAEDGRETIRITPLIGLEVLKNAGLDTLRTDWVLQNISSSDATTLERRADTLSISAQQAAIKLTLGIANDTGYGAVYYPC